MSAMEEASNALNCIYVKMLNWNQEFSCTLIEVHALSEACSS